MPRLLPALTLGLGFGLASCMTAAPYARPVLPLPANWQQPVERGDAPAAAWWQAFADPELLRLQAEAEQANPELQIALRHVLAADAAVALARAQQAFQLSLGAAPVDAAAVSAVNRKAGLYAIGFSARYELDFWGRLARGVDAATAAREASRFDAGTVQITLQAQLARSYFRLRELDERAGLLERRRTLLQEAQRLQAARLTAGRSANEALQAAEAAVEAAGAEREQLQLERRQTELELAALLGKMPESFALPAAALRSQLQIPALPALLPATVVERRPDLQAAEQRLREAHAEVEVARAEWLPKISLDAELGLVSGPLRAPLRGSRGLIGIGPELDWTLLDGGRRQAELDARTQAREIAVIEYRKAVLGALKDVETALLLRDAARLQAERQARVQAQDQATLAREALRLAAGRGSRLQQIESEQRALLGEEAAVSRFREQLDAAVALYLALGGGWQPPLPP